MPTPPSVLSEAAPLIPSVFDFSLPSGSASKPTGSLFGNLHTTPTQQSATASQPQQISTLFGSTTSQPQQAGGLFSSNTQNPQANGGGLFGSQQNTPKPGGLFGSANAQQSQPQQTVGASGSTNAQQSQPQQTAGLFGSIGQNQNTSQQSQQQSKVFGGFGSQNKTSSLLYVSFRAVFSPSFIFANFSTVGTRKLHYRVNRAQRYLLLRPSSPVR